MATRLVRALIVLITFSAAALADGPNFADLPKDLAIVRSEGNGKRVFALFEDPLCPACKYFESQLDSLTDYTVYIYTYPILGKRSVDTSTAVWCSGNPLGTWERAVSTKTPLAADSKCLNTVGRILEVGERYGVNSTPTLIFENSSSMSGAIPAKYLSAMLNRASQSGGAKDSKADQPGAPKAAPAKAVVAGPKLIEIPGGGGTSTPRPKAPAVFIFANGDRLESDDYLVTKEDLFISRNGQKTRYSIKSLDKAATKNANIERGIVISFPTSTSEFNLNF